MKRIKHLSILTSLVAVFVLVLGMGTVLASGKEDVTIVPTQVDRNVVTYSIPLYEGKEVAKKFTILKDTLKERGLLIQSSTSVRIYTANGGKMLFSHEIIALNTGKSEIPATEFVSVMSNSVQQLDKFSMKLQKEKGFKIDSAYSQEVVKGTVAMFIVALSK